MKMLFKKLILHIQKKPPYRTIWCQNNNFYTVKNNVDFSNESVDLAHDIYENNRTKTSPASPLLISHGFLGQKQNFKSVVKSLLNVLEPARKIIVVDNRNHGDSPHTPNHSYELMCADFLRLLDKLNISKMSLLGHSMGGRAAMFTALKHPERVTNLIVEDISPINHNNLNSIPIILETFRKLELEKRTGSLPIVRKEIIEELKSIEEDLGTRQFFASNIKLNKDGSFGWKINLETLQKDFDNIGKFPDLGNVQYNGPTFFIMGRNSNFVSEEDFDGIKKIFPNVEFQYVENSGHWIHYENSQDFVKYVANFLNKSKI